MRLEGELDLSEAGRLQDVLTTAGQSADVVALDLADLSFVDLSGLRAFHVAHEAVAQRGSRLVLVSPGRQVVRCLQLTGFDHLEISEDRTILERNGTGPG